MERYLRKGLTNLYRWVLMALAETALVTPWLILIYRSADATAWARALPGSWLLILTFLGGAVWEAGRPKGEPTPKQDFRSRLTGMLVGSVALYLLAYFALPANLHTGVLRANMAWAALPAIWYVWYQAAESVVAGLEYGRVFGRFTAQAVGMVLGVICVMMAGLAHEARIQVMLYWDLFMLFGAGLTLLLVAREGSLRKGQAALGETGTGGESSARKLTILVAVMLGLTLLASQIVSPEQLAGWVAAGGRLLRGPVDWLVNVAMLIMIRWAAMVYWLVEFLRGVFAHGKQLPPPNQEANAPRDPLPVELYKDVQTADWTPYLKVAALVVAAAVVVLWLYRLQRRRQEALGGEVDEQRVSLGFWSGLLADLRLWMSRLRRKPPVLEAEANALTAGEGIDPHDPRALYRRLQGWGFRLGRGRKRSETPNQYSEALAALRADARPGAEAVTAVYNQARYGPRPPAPEAVGRAAAALEELQQNTPPRS